MREHKISTNKFNLEEKVYFKILVRTRLKQYWWLYLLLVMLVFLMESIGGRSLSNYLVWFVISYPVFSFFYLYFWVVSKKNSARYKEQILEFDEDYIVQKIEGGTENKIPFSKIIQFTETRTFFLLYLAKEQFIYVSKDSFKSSADLYQFDEYVRKQLVG